MALIIEDKLLFVHVAKTGGTYVRELMDKNFQNVKESGKFKIHDHYGIDECINYNENYKNLYSFGFVRHPVDWLKSRWSWAKITKFSSKFESNEEASKHWMASVWDEDFDEFVKKYLKNGKAEAWNTFSTKLSIGTDNEVDYIGKYETLTFDLMKIMSINELSIDKQSFNINKRKVGSKGRFKNHTNIKNPLTEYEIMELEKDVINKFYSLNENR